VCPPPVPRSYSHPRCKALSSSVPSATAHLGNARSGDLYAGEDRATLCPRNPFPLTTTSHAPLPGSGQGPGAKALQRVTVAPHTVVIIGTRPLCMPLHTVGCSADRTPPLPGHIQARGTQSCRLCRTMTTPHVNGSYALGRVIGLQGCGWRRLLGNVLVPISDKTASVGRGPPGVWPAPSLHTVTAAYGLARIILHVVRYFHGE
jgi:hypothetical protein